MIIDDDVFVDMGRGDGGMNGDGCDDDVDDDGGCDGSNGDGDSDDEAHIRGFMAANISKQNKFIKQIAIFIYSIRRKAL